MTLLRNSLCVLALLVVVGAANQAVAQVGYYRAYRPDPYRELNQTGKYHGYWRDLGYGFRAQQNDFYYPAYGTPYYGVYDYGYGGVPYGNIQTAPGYYHPPASFPYRRR